MNSCKRFTGHVEYAQRITWTVLGILSIVLLPALLILCTIFSYIRNNREGSSGAMDHLDSGKSSWRFSERSSASSRQTTPLKYGISSPLSESSSSPTGQQQAGAVGGVTDTVDAHKKRKYDGVYRTNEPLPGKTATEF